MTKRLLILSYLFLIGLSIPALAATGTVTPLNISVDHGVSVTLSAPAASVFIANPEIADVQVMSPTTIMVFGKRTGETTFMASDANGHTLAHRTVIVMQDLANLRQELDAAIPGNKIQVQALPNGIVLTGATHDPSAVADAYKLAQRYLSQGGDIINRIKVVGSNQIHIRVRFAEVSRSVDNSLGFDWQSIGSIGGFALGIATGAAGIGSGANILSNRPNNASLAAPNDAIGFSKTGGKLNINGLVDALAQDGLITILAEPNLTAMSGETASFLAGGEFPVPIPQGNGTISIEYKKYGVSLEFTPTLISENRINLHVKPEVSKLSSTGTVTINNNVVPSLTVRKAETTVEVASGQSFAMAGLLDNDQTQTVNKYPILGDLPVLGALFRSDRYQNGQSELVIIITPYIVTPNGEQQLALPTDGFSPPSEAERLIGLRNNSSDPEARKISGTPPAVRIEPPVSPAPIVVPMSGGEPEPTVETPSRASIGGEAPAPNPAPVAMVTRPIALNPKPATSASLRPVPSQQAGPGNLNPSGPGGFLLE